MAGAEPVPLNEGVAFRPGEDSAEKESQATADT